MFHDCLPWLAAFCCAAVPGLVSGKEMPEKPALAVFLDEWRATTQGPGLSSKDIQSFSLDLKVVETSSPWKVAYGGESGFKLALTDSEGNSPAEMSCDYSEGSSWQRNGRAGTVFLRARSWLPSEEAGWVEARGELPFIMYRSSAVSESAVLKPAVKGFSVPLVLKNAGLDGADVKVELKGHYDGKDGGGKTCVLRLGVYSAVPFGFLDLELSSRDGAPLLAENYGSTSGSSAKSHSWHRFFRMDEREEEIKVAVKYAAGLRKVMVPVHIRCGLFGVVEQPETRNKEE